MDWYIPILIFIARICDVSLGTTRMIFVFNGWKYRAAALGFVEVSIWALAVGGLIAYLSNPIALVAYAGGFAAGTLVGMSIDEKMKLGYRVIQVMNPDQRVRVTAIMRDAGYRVTRFSAEGRDGPVEACQLFVKRREADAAMTRISEVAPRAFMWIERCDRAVGGVFATAADPSVRRSPLGKAGFTKK